jgi:hypothetical protein
MMGMCTGGRLMFTSDTDAELHIFNLEAKFQNKKLPTE